MPARPLARSSTVVIARLVSPCLLMHNNRYHSQCLFSSLLSFARPDIGKMTRILLLTTLTLSILNHFCVSTKRELLQLCVYTGAKIFGKTMPVRFLHSWTQKFGARIHNAADSTIKIHSNINIKANTWTEKCSKMEKLNKHSEGIDWSKTKQ